MKRYSRDNYVNEFRLKSLKKYYSKVVKKNKFKTRLILCVSIISLLLAIAVIQNHLILNLGISSIFIVPAECLVSIILIGSIMGRLNELTSKEEEAIYQDIISLQEELDNKKINNNEKEYQKNIKFEENNAVSLSQQNIKTDLLVDEYSLSQSQNTKPKTLVKKYKNTSN